MTERVNDFPEKTFQKTSPKIILETAKPLNNEQKESVLEILSKKFNRQVQMAEKTNVDLIGGYRLEISGIAIENNLLNQLLHATETVQ